VGDVPEILAGGEVGILVPPHDPAALADAIDRLIDDPALRRRLSLEARRRVEREYGQDRVAARLAEIYAQLLPGRGRSGERGWIAPSNVRRDEGQ
jgi:glycosyltransferase involved in cell wall biosynthesis